jgi:hypothetical protein
MASDRLYTHFGAQLGEGGIKLFQEAIELIGKLAFVLDARNALCESVANKLLDIDLMHVSV